MADRFVSLSGIIFLLGVMVSGIASGAEIKIENRMGGGPGTGCATPIDTDIVRLQVQGNDKLLPLYADAGGDDIPSFPSGSYSDIPAGSDSMIFNTTATTYRVIIEMGSWTAALTKFAQRRYTNHNTVPGGCNALPFYRYVDFIVTNQGPGLLTLRVQPSGYQYQVGVQGGTATLNAAPVVQKVATDFSRTVGPYIPINEKPALNTQSFTIAENSAAATVVGTIMATDPDGSQPLAYSVTGGTGLAVFAVNPTTGQITVANSSRLDFEATPNFTLQVQVTDKGTPQLSASATITIELINVDEEVPAPPKGLAVQ